MGLGCSVLSLNAHSVGVATAVPCADSQAAGHTLIAGHVKGMRVPAKFYGKPSVGAMSCQSAIAHGMLHAPTTRHASLLPAIQQTPSCSA